VKWDICMRREERREKRGRVKWVRGDKKDKVRQVKSRRKRGRSEEK